MAPLILKPDVDYRVFVVVADKDCEAPTADSIVGWVASENLRRMAEEYAEDRRTLGPRYAVPSFAVCIRKWMEDFEASAAARKELMECAAAQQAALQPPQEGEQ